jgi:predicted transcriptional regulator YdeE
MNVQVINQAMELNVYGFSGTAVDKNYAATAFKLMDRMWQIVKSNHLKNKGLNIWVYEESDHMFAGVELDDIPNSDTGLEHKTITLLKYGYYKHTGPYHLIKQAVQNMTKELTSQGYTTALPYIEIYGHHTNDETKQETELLMSLK